MKYVKTWMGVVTGSMAGRNDGYPERKYKFYETKETLLKELGKHSKDETIYALEQQVLKKPIKGRPSNGGNKMTVKTKLKDMAIGSEFDAGPATLRILDHFTDETTLVITAESIGDRPFNLFPLLYERPEGFNLNDWRISTIRKDLNENFLSALKAAGKINTDRIVTTEWDLSDHQGGAGYGTSQDKIGLLSQKQFEKYAEQDLLELDDWWWLITPHAGNSSNARRAYTYGSLYYNNAYYGYGGVRPALRLESGIEIVLEEDEVNLSDSVLLEGFTTKPIYRL